MSTSHTRTAAALVGPSAHPDTHSDTHANPMHPLTDVVAPECAGAFGTGIANASFGELLQGVLPVDGRHFLVTLPVNLYSRARIELREDAALTIRPAHKTKSLAAAERALRALGYNGGGEILVDSDMREGKGMSSSTADMVAAVRAAAAAVDAELRPDALCDAIRGIEPADGLMYEGCVAFFHREVLLKSRLGGLPRMALVGLDEGGTVDTVDFNRRGSQPTGSQLAEYASLLARIESAVARGDCAEIGRIATRSAFLNQARNPKRHLEALVSISENVGGLGVVVAHSGTVAAVLLDAADDDFQRRRADCCRAVSALGEDSIECTTL